MYTGNMTGVVIGTVTGFFLLLLLVVIFIIIKKRRRRRPAFSMFMDDVSDTNSICKSAPISRNQSPKLSKRKSCPEAYGALVRSATIDCVPDFTLPPERVQPYPGSEWTPSTSAFHYQQNLLGSLEPSLYGNQADEHSSQLPPSVHGRLWFSAVYDAAVEQLSVTLVKIKELVDRKKDKCHPDPFVKVYLLPDERTCRTSKVRKKSIAPVYNETFLFQLPAAELTDRQLRFSVYDVDKRRVRHSLGHVVAPLIEIDVTKGEVLWRDLELNVQSASQFGEVNIGLTYMPHVDKIKITIYGARNLKQADLGVEIGMYVKLHMHYGRKLVKSKKTMTQKGGKECNFNESFPFSITGKHVDSCNFVISLMHTAPTPLGHDEEYGRISIGSFMFARGEELLHWQDMLAQPKTTLNKWHILSPKQHS